MMKNERKKNGSEKRNTHVKCTQGTSRQWVFSIAVHLMICFWHFFLVFFCFMFVSSCQICHKMIKHNAKSFFLSPSTNFASLVKIMEITKWKTPKSYSTDIYTYVRLCAWICHRYVAFFALFFCFCILICFNV